MMIFEIIRDDLFVFNGFTIIHIRGTWWSRFVR